MISKLAVVAGMAAITKKAVKEEHRDKNEALAKQIADNYKKKYLKPKVAI